LTVLDAYAVIAYLRAEPATGEVQHLLRAGGACLTAVGLAEVLDHLVWVIGAHEDDATLDLAQLGLLEAAAVDSAIGAEAGRLRARYYHRTRCAVSMADCIAAQTARAKGEPLATADPHLLDLCHAENIGTFVLPGSDGTRWTAPA